MGKMLDPKRLMSARQERHRRRRRRQLRPRNSEGAKRTRYSVPSLPEEIWCHIHSLMSFKDAARAACVSRAFRHSWRCHPNLICCIGILGSDFINKFDRIMKNHSGIGINFPCSLLADGRASSMRHLYLGNCGFHPTINLDLRNLTRLHLINVQLLLGESLRMKRLSLHYPDAMYYAHAKLPSNAPNLETLTLECSTDKMVDTPILPSKFLHLKCLTIDHTIISSSPAYNYLYLVYFLDACPSLETFLLGISQNHMEHDSIIGDSSHMRQMPGHRHDNLRSVEITGFYSAKSLIELTCYILDNTVALKYLTLDTTRGFFSCSTGEHDRCFPMDKIMITEANRAVLAIQTYIERKVPSTVKLNVVKPCSRCHAVESYL
uniref:Uncharacterized protein n=2 Tax=Oryza rufipogon TaxID=4529 RepID=A0A0E0QTH0_ORYRU